jgi:hypothetical protein
MITGTRPAAGPGRSSSSHLRSSGLILDDSLVPPVAADQRLPASVRRWLRASIRPSLSKGV